MRTAIAQRPWPDVKAWGLTILAAAVVTVGCGGTVDVSSTCTIDAEEPHYSRLVELIGTSKFWQRYCQHMESIGGASGPLAELSLGWERRRIRSAGGDYDPGYVTVVFEVRHIRTRQTLYEREEEVRLQDFMVGFFDEDASREEIQEAAFKATEERVYPFLERWVDLAAIRAIGAEGSDAYDLEPFLSKLVDDDWQPLDVKAEARKALKQIQ
jgi:hypothetical protein